MFRDRKLFSKNEFSFLMVNIEGVDGVSVGMSQNSTSCLFRKQKSHAQMTQFYRLDSESLDLFQRLNSE